MVCLFQAFQGRGLYLPGLIIALCGRVPLRLIGRFFRRSNGRQKVLLSPRSANRNGLNALLLGRKSCLRTSSSSLTNLQLVSNDDRYERYLHNGFVYSWRRRGSLECQVLNWMLFVRLVFGLDFFHPFGWQISATRATFPWWHFKNPKCGRFAFVERTTRVPSKSLSVFELFSRIKSHVKMALFVK